MFNKVFYFFALWAYILGSIGGFGYALYSKAYLIAICILVLAILAFPTAKSYFQKLIA